jgi:hypothetical protein
MLKCVWFGSDGAIVCGRLRVRMIFPYLSQTALTQFSELLAVCVLFIDSEWVDSFVGCAIGDFSKHISSEDARVLGCSGL